jgi:folate-binding protein YgfZ
VRRGDARFPADLDGDSLPAEAGWDAAPTTDRAKGCFLGQEAVAKVANLGHPARIVVPVTAPLVLAAGEPVVAGGREVGVVTSADGPLGIARIRWDARDEPLVTGSGIPLERR